MPRLTAKCQRARLGSMASAPQDPDFLPRYDISQTYDWNYAHAPSPPPKTQSPPIAGNWSFCGHPVRSPLGVAAGPLLNGRWLVYYAALGFDVLTYKTVRSRKHECYELPNLQPVSVHALDRPGERLIATGEMQGSWAVS